MQTPRPDVDGPKPFDLLNGYAGPTGAGAQNDEMLAPDGTVKPVWAAFVDHLNTLGPERLENRFARGDQYLRDAGVLYRQYDETLSSEREWPLSHIPVILDEEEWQSISQGLIERADLLDFVLRDFYGDNALVASGQLPATLLGQNPAWLRPMVGVGRDKAHLLNNLSFEVGRGPDGKWWVISDLIEAPSTAGFAIENRIAMTRVFTNFFNAANVHRLAGYFQDFKRTLSNLKGRSEGEIALLSPGPLNESYAEHAYMARYLGLLLVEGEDLIVQDGKAMVRTVAGPKPISLLWSRLPGAMFDPLELNPETMLGAAGLVQAIRDGSLRTVNMVGAGVLETRALMAFLPKIARAQLGRGLSMPNIATWWCGQDSQRDHVLANLSRMMLGNAFSTRPLMADPNTLSLGGESDPTRMNQLADMLNAEGRNFVGQEAVTLSTTPAYENGRLVARPMCLRISLVRSADGWSVMPGGYARISAGADATALAMQRGGKVADVWVSSKSQVKTPSLLMQGTAQGRSATHAILPSRAADNLFWLGRYVERAEQNMRLFRAYFARVSDGADHGDKLPKFMRAQLMDHVAPEAQTMSKRFADPLRLGLQAAGRITDRFSPDGMMTLRGLTREMKALERRTVAVDDIPVEVSGLLRQITGFAGLVHENMYRSDGWRFLSIGLSLERAANMCTILAACTQKNAPIGALDLTLELGDSVTAHRMRFTGWPNEESVIDLLALDPHNPRAIRYHMARAREHVANLPHDDADHHLSDVGRLVQRVDTRLATSGVPEISPAFLIQLRSDIWGISDALNEGHLV